MKRIKYYTRGLSVIVYAVIATAALAMLTPNVEAEDAYVEAIAPGYEIVVGPNVEFSWFDNVSRVQRSFELRTSDDDYPENSSRQEYLWSDFHFGSAWWSVAIYNCKNTSCWIGTTSTQNFFHYNNVPGTTNYRLEPFEYKRGFRSPRTISDYTNFFELTKDYRIDIASYFTDLDALPRPIDWDDEWEKTEEQRLELYDYIRNLSVESDFIKLNSGVMTLKKGYRWDGTSNPGVGEEESSDLRSSCVHDAFYDLIRMGYLDWNDENHFNWEWGDAGYMNRLVADTMHYRIAVEDKDKPQDKAFSDWRTLRKGGRGKANKDKLLRAFKYHVSELTAWVTDDGEIDLHWLPAHATDYDPKNYRSKPHNYDIFRTTSDSSVWCHLGNTEVSTWDTENHSKSKVYYTDHGDKECDTPLTPGQIYYYWIRANDPDSDNDDWTDQEENDYGGGYNDNEDFHPNFKERHYDESVVEAVVPVIGAGNALQLNGVDQYVISTIEPGNSTSASWTFEAWVYPEEGSGLSTILALSGLDPARYAYYTPLKYDSENRKFCYSEWNMQKCTDPSLIEPGYWYHLAVVIDGEDCLLYVDGQPALSFKPFFAAKEAPESIPTFGIGASFWITYEWDEDGGDDSNGAWAYDISTWDHFKGKIDELRVWNVARKQAEIQEYMYASLRGYDANLIALWHFDEPDRTHTAYDMTIHGRDGEVHQCTEPNSSCFVASEAMNMPPVALCANVVIQTEPSTCHAHASVDNGSFDPDGDGVTLQETPPGPYGLGETDVTLTVTDELGVFSTCSATVTVVDQTQPLIMCNVPDVIAPTDTPISFTVTATDNCTVSSVDITQYEIWKPTKKGKTIDKVANGLTEIAGDTITFKGSAGVGTHLGWTVVATDTSANSSEEFCEVQVVNPGKGK